MTLEGKFKDEGGGDERKQELIVNSLDFVVTPDRLSVHRSYAQGVYLYGNDNNYPRKLINLSDRCSELVTVKEIQAEFVAGNGFPGATAEDVINGTAIVINEEGETAYDMLQFFAEQKANINVAIHVNYNALGQKAGFNLIQYDFVRQKIRISGEKYKKFIITTLWHLENDFSNAGFDSRMEQFNKWMKDKETDINFTALECFAFNDDPIAVREQIELAGGIDKYPGQLFYAKKGKDIYQKARYDSLADKFQFLSECDLGSLSSVQNGYSASGVFKYFSNNDGTKEVQDLKKKGSAVKGSSNTGRFIMLPMLPNNENKMSTNVFESTEIQNRDGLYKEQRITAKSGIDEKYGVPNGVKGADNAGNFATQDMQAQFDAYNTRTQPIRTECEIELNKLFRGSVFDIKLPIKIDPLQFLTFHKMEEEAENTDEKTTEEEETKKNKDETTD